MGGREGGDLFVLIDFIHAALGFLLRDDFAGVLDDDLVGVEGAGCSESVSAVFSLIWYQSRYQKRSGLGYI